MGQARESGANEEEQEQEDQAKQEGDQRLPHRGLKGTVQLPAELGTIQQLVNQS